MARPVGIDVSSYQGYIDWDSVAKDGFTFAWAKATEGTSFIDGDFTANEANAKAAGVYIGAYHFAHPDDDPYTSGADAEADYFWNQAAGYIKGGGTYLVPMLDFEVTGSSDSATWINEWCNDIKSKAAAAGVTANPVVYTTGSIASSLGSSVTQWPLWIADPNGESSQSGGPTVSLGPWGTWTFWQYSWTGSVSGVSDACDKDVINGDDATLQAFVIGSGGKTSTYYWDSAGGGGWSTSVAHWSTSSSGGSDIDWTDGKYAYFSAGSQAEGAGDITISSHGLDTTGIKIAQGTLTFNSSQFNLDSGPDKTNYCLISVASGLTATFNCTIGQNGTVGLDIDNGGGTVDLTAANIYNGGTYLAEGTLAIGNNSALGGGSLNFEGGSIQSSSSAAHTLNNAVILSKDTTFGGTGNLTFTGPVDDGGASKTFTVNSGITVEFDGVISDGGADAGAVNTLAGGGTLVFGGVNTYNKPTVISSGTMAVGNNSALGVGAINFEGGSIQSSSSAARTLNNAVILSQDTTFGGTGNLTFTGPVDDGGASKTFTVNSGITVTFSGEISDGGADAGAVNTLAGGGTLVFGGVNTYNKPTVISSGTMAVGNDSALGVGAINFEGGSIQSSSSAAFTLNNAVILSQDTTFGGTGNLTFTGPVDDGGASKTFTVNSGITVEFDGVISDGGADAGAVNTLAGGGTLVFTGANTYNKPTVISSGTMAVGNNSALGVGAINFEGGSIQSSSSAAFTLNNAVILSQDTTFGGTGNLTFTGPVDDGGASKTFTVNNGITVEFDGVISDGGADAGAVNTLAGGGTLVFGGVNTYNKPTVISSGTLALGSGGSINNSPSISIAAGATFDVSAIASYVLSGSTTISASGAAAPATIKGGATVSLGSQPIILAYDGSHPALTISQGALSLQGNAFTVNGSALALGAYTIIKQASGNIAGSGSYSVTGTAIPATGVTASVSVSGGNVILTVANTTTTTLNALTPSTYGQSVIFTATIAPAPAGGTVQFYDNGAALGSPATVSHGTASYSTNTLSVGTHPITASYSGTTGYAASSTANPSNQQVTLPPNSAPVFINSVLLLGNGSVQMNFTGVAGYTYLIETATNLNPPIAWTILCTNAADTNGLFSFTDINATNFGDRYYRTAIQQ